MRAPCESLRAACALQGSEGGRWRAASVGATSAAPNENHGAPMNDESAENRVRLSQAAVSGCPEVQNMARWACLCGRAGYHTCTVATRSVSPRRSVKVFVPTIDLGLRGVGSSGTGRRARAPTEAAVSSTPTTPEATLVHQPSEPPAAAEASIRMLDTATGTSRHCDRSASGAESWRRRAAVTVEVPNSRTSRTTPSGCSVASRPAVRRPGRCRSAAAKETRWSARAGMREAAGGFW